MQTAEELLASWHALMRDPLLSSQSLKERALRQDVGFRSVLWRIWLQQLPAPTSGLESISDAWQLALARSRDEYDQLRAKYLTPPDGNTAFSEQDDNPLSLEQTRWTTWFADLEIRKEIQRDVERTCPDMDYFRSPHVQNAMANILQVFVKLNSDIGYRQGMHELLAPILWAVEADSIPSIDLAPASSKDLLMYTTLDATYIEHDAWSIFQKLMLSAKSWYDPSLSSPISVPTQTGWVASTSQRYQMVQPIIALSVRIQSTLLAQVDPALSQKLSELEIEPQMYCLRWLRVMFSRELPWKETLQLWDMIFSEDPTLKCVEWICVALLLRIRNDLINATYSSALQLVMRYPEPPNEDYQIDLLFKQALALRDRPTSKTAMQIQLQNNRHGFAASPTYDDLTPGLPSHHSRTPQRHSTSGISAYRNTSFQPPAIVNDLVGNVLERAEALGINRAVKDTLGELKKNVGYYQQALASSEATGGGFPQGVASLPFRSAHQQAKLAAELRSVKASNADCAVALERCVAALEKDEQKEDVALVLKHLVEVLAGRATYNSSVASALPQTGPAPTPAPPSTAHRVSEPLSPVYLPRPQPMKRAHSLSRVPVSSSTSTRVPLTSPNLASSTSSASSTRSEEASEPQSASQPTKVSYPPTQKRTVYSPGPRSAAAEADPLGVNK